MDPKDLQRQKPLSALYGHPTGAAKNAGLGKSISDDNPSIASLLKRHPPPPRRLPAHIAAGGRAAGRSESSTTPAPVEEEMDVMEEVEEEHRGAYDHDDDDYVPDDYDYVPDGGDDYVPDGGDDDMSEEDVHGDDEEPNTNIDGSIDISSGEEKGSVKGKKKRKKDTSGSENSLAWKHFEKVYVDDDNNPDGPKVLKARCRHCSKEYAYVQGSSTSTLNRHFNGKCKKLNAKRANQLIQKRLGFNPLNVNANIPASTLEKYRRMRKMRKKMWRPSSCLRVGLITTIDFHAMFMRKELENGDGWLSCYYFNFCY